MRFPRAEVLNTVVCAGDIGNASKMNSVLQVVGGVSLAALAEGLALADRAGLNQADLLDVLALTPLASPHLILKGRGQYLTTSGDLTDNADYATLEPVRRFYQTIEILDEAVFKS